MNEILERISQAIHRAKDEENCRVEKARALSERGRGSETSQGNPQKVKGTSSRLDENRVVEVYAKENNLWVPIYDTYDLGTPLGRGNENEVYLSKNKQTVYKVNNLFNSRGKISRLIEKITLHNQLFPDTSYKMVGITGFNGRSIYPILQQDFITRAEPTSIDEIHIYMNCLGFTKLNDYTYCNEKYEVSDLRPRNVLKDIEGDIYVIDAELRIFS